MATLLLRVVPTLAAAYTLPGTEVRTLHAYPTPVVYTSVCRGKPTLVGLRGYAAHLAIEELNALNQKQPALLEWMYGDVAKDAFLP